MAKTFTAIQPNVLESICRILADTDTGLTGGEIAKYMADAGMKDITPQMTKWKRLYNSCIDSQNRTGVSNDVLKFIQTSFHPSRFINNKDYFEYKRSDLNQILSFVGLSLAENGKFRPVDKSHTIDDAERRATNLLYKLKDRNVHDDVLIFCKAELLADNYFHAVFETTKSVADRIRKLSGLTKDGNELIDLAFGINNPILLINSLSSETEKSEHKGFANLLKGFFGMFRNTTAHAPKIAWEITENDALDIMSMASLMHRKLANAKVIASQSTSA